jgi:hypothetical protein
MATRSGLDAQAGMVAESTYGTLVTPTRFLEFDTEGFEYVPTFLEGEGIRAGRKFKRDSRVGVTRKDVNGKLDLKVATKGMGLLIKHMIGSSGTTTVIGATAAYQQIHIPGDLYGKSMTIQIGKPEPGTGTVRPFAYLGCKCSQWELSVSDGEHLKLSTTWDGRDEDTSTGLATASYASGAGLFNFSHATLKLGGTATTGGTPSQISVAGGAAVAAIINSITIRGENPMAGERYGVGNAGLKSEPLENDYPTATGSFDAEFAKTELYDVFKAATSVALELAFSVGDAGGGNPYLLSFIAPKIKLKKAPAQVNGPGIVRMSTEFEIYDDETNAPFQFKLVSTDTTI